MPYLGSPPEWEGSWCPDPELIRKRHSNADHLLSGEQAGKRLGIGGGRIGAGGQGGKALTRRLLIHSLLCLPRELLGSPQAWPLLLASCLVPGVLQLTSLPLLPESPRYLLIDRGDTETCLVGESLTSGHQTTPDQGARLPRAWSHFLGFIYQRKLSLSLCYPSIPSKLFIKGLS